MGIKLSSIDSKSSLRKLTYPVFGGSASAAETFIQIPYACTYDKAVFGRALASATCIVGICNASYSQALVADATTVASASGVIGTSVCLSATAIFHISANSLIHVLISGSTTDGALNLVFSLNENKEK